MPAGSYVQATYLAGTLYARAMERHHETGLTCHGSDCFQTVFLINAGLSLGAVVMSTLLWRRTKHLYSRVIEVTKAERAKRGLRVRPCHVTPSLQLRGGHALEVREIVSDGHHCDSE